MRPDLRHLGNLDSFDLPEPVAPVVRASKLDASEELDELTNEALRNLREVLEGQVDLGLIKEAKLRMQAATTVLNTQVRVDEGRLKRSKLDALPRLLELIAREEGRAGAVRMLEGELA